jgi:hypothetical protein
MYWLLPTDATVYPDVVNTPVPTMLATTTQIAIGRPNSAGIASARGESGEGGGSTDRRDWSFFDIVVA